MSLLLDLGNSCCKFQILQDDVVTEYGVRIYLNTSRLSVIETLLQDHKITNKVIVCSVLDDECNDQLIKILIKHGIKDYYFLNPAVDTFGIQLTYQNPSHLGADRLAVLIAAHDKYSGNTCIVDCGTAITIDALDAGAKHHGGVILPGLMSMRQALSLDTDIKCNESGERFNVFSTTTQDAIYTGCLSAIVGGIHHVINIMQTRNSFDQVIVTGGDAETIMPMLTQQVEHCPKLVLDGLMVVLSNL